MLKFLLNNFCSVLMIRGFEIFNAPKRTLYRQKKILLFLVEVNHNFPGSDNYNITRIFLLRYMLLLIILKYFMLKHIPKCLFTFCLSVKQFHSLVKNVLFNYYVLGCHTLSYSFRLVSNASIYVAIIQFLFRLCHMLSCKI